MQQLRIQALAECSHPVHFEIQVRQLIVVSDWALAPVVESQAKESVVQLRVMTTTIKSGVESLYATKMANQQKAKNQHENEITCGRKVCG